MSEQATESTPNNNEPVNEAAMTVVRELSVDGDVVDTVLLKNILEAALLTSQEPLALPELNNLAEVVKGGKLVEETLNQLAQEYRTRGIELTQVASGWRFRARPEMQVYLNRLNPQKQPRYSRAVMETLAIIAYRQPGHRVYLQYLRASPVGDTQ